MYTVYLEQAAEKDLRRLPSIEYGRIIFQIKVLAKIQRPHGCRKLTGSKNDWRIRIGDYRVLYEIDDKGKVILIMRVRHRREVYE